MAMVGDGIFQAHRPSRFTTETTSSFDYPGPAFEIPYPIGLAIARFFLGPLPVDTDFPTARGIAPSSMHCWFGAYAAARQWGRPAGGAGCKGVAFARAPSGL
jgi:hypothetical protein